MITHNMEMPKGKLLLSETSDLWEDAWKTFLYVPGMLTDIKHYYAHIIKH